MSISAEHALDGPLYNETDTHGYTEINFAAFAYEAMPSTAQRLGPALPLTHFLRVARGITLKGARSDDVAPEVDALELIHAVLIVISASRLRKSPPVLRWG